MKKTKLYTALLSLSISLNAFSLGLGELKVHSSLDQPFDAEIELLDVGNHSLYGIKANLGSVEDYQRVGLERSFGLGDLSFTVEKNRQGQAIIKIHSMQRVSDPFIQLLVDLAWAKGQVYREYTVLLDPPHYDLVVTKKMKHIVQKRDHTEPGVVDKVVYEAVGPTHDWRSKQPISSPDDEQNASYESQLPAVPVLSRSDDAIPPINTFLSASQDVVPSLRPIISTNVEGNPAIKAQMDVAVSAIDSVRESNALLKEQVQLMRDQNKNLQDQLNKHNAEVAALHAQLDLLIRRQGIAGQVITSSEKDHHSHLWIWALLLLGFGSAYIGWRKWRFMDNSHMNFFVKPSPSKGDVKSDDGTLVDTVAENKASEPVVIADMPKAPTEEFITPKSADHIEFSSSDDIQISQPVSKPLEEPKVEPPAELIITKSMGGIEFALIDEIQMSPPVPADIPEPTVSVEEKPMEVLKQEDTHHIEFVTEPVLEKKSAARSVKKKQTEAVRSKAALETILTLAQTYIDMGDIAAAKESLQEVIDYGNKKQQEAAKALMSDLKL